jgi:large subunit ribosomal protein L24e
MVERRVCTFCGDEIEPGTGRMYIKKDGVVYNFCSSKCFKNLVILGRVPRRITWTRYYEREKQVRMKGLPTAEPQPKARKVKKGEEKPKEEKPSEKKEEAKPAEKKAEEKPKTAEKAPAPKPATKKLAETRKLATKKPEAAKKEPEKTAEGAKKE